MGPAWLPHAGFGTARDAIILTAKLQCERSAVQVTWAHGMQAEQEKVMAEEMRSTKPLAGQRSDSNEDMATTMFIRHILFRCTSMEFMNFIDLQGFKSTNRLTDRSQTDICLCKFCFPSCCEGFPDQGSWHPGISWQTRGPTFMCSAIEGARFAIKYS